MENLERDRVANVSTTDKLVAAPNYSGFAGLVPDLNTTRPPPLNIPEPPHPLAWPSSKSRDPKNWDFKYLFTLGKTYGKFYWAGIKKVWANQKTFRAINGRKDGRSDISIQVREYCKTGKMNAAELKLTYNEYEFLQRTRRDLLRLIPFSLVVLVCGEFTPLAILLLGSRVVPGTCAIPKQVKADLEKTLEKEETFLQETAKIVSEKQSLEKAAASSQPQAANNHTNMLLLLQAYRLNLAPKFSLNLPPFLRNLYHSMFLQRKIHAHSSNIVYAAYHIQAEGGWSKRSPQDMYEFGNVYGLYSLRAYAKDMLAKDKEIATEEMKRSLLPIFEDEIQAILKPSFLSEVGVNTAALIHAKKHSKDLKRLAADLDKRMQSLPKRSV